MDLQVSVPIKAARDDVWRVISDLENAATTMSGIDKIEILEKPESGIVGLKWRETRTMFGKTAVETLWITEAVANDHYLVEARNHGSIYRTKVFVADRGGETLLGMDFRAQPETLLARVLSFLMAPLMKGATEKALRQDLEDVKQAVEAK